MTRALARRMADVLAGAWRAGAPSVALAPGELAAMMPHLTVTGSLPLVWARTRDDGVHRAALAQVARTLAHEPQIVRLFLALRAAGVEPVLAKGWALARLYGEPAARPSADIDLFVVPGDLARATAALADPALAAIGVDLHSGFPDLEEADPAPVFARSLTVPLAGVPVRVLAPEDHLRLVALHLWRHAAWRPVWMCDVGALVESGPLDWDRVLGGDARRADWVASAVALAHRLVGASVAGSPVEPARLPRWLEPAVLDHWVGMGRHLYDGVPLAAHLLRPSGLIDALRRRWPSPLQASVSRRARFDGRPRWPLQLADCAVRAVQSIARFPSEVRALVRR